MESDEDASDDADSMEEDDNDDEEGEDEDGEDDGLVDSLCAVCNSGGEVLCCDTCPLVYHLDCVGLRRTPRGIWKCAKCKKPSKRGGGGAKKGGRSKKRASKKARTVSAATDDDAESKSEDDDEEQASDEDDEDFDVGGDVNAMVSMNNGVHRSAMSQCDEIIRLLRKHEEAWPFLEPVDTEEVPDYLDIVSEPMDLQTVKDKLENLDYLEPISFYADVKKIFTNCSTYNHPESDAGKAGIALQSYFEVRACAARLERCKNLLCVCLYMTVCVGVRVGCMLGE